LSGGKKRQIFKTSSIDQKGISTPLEENKGKSKKHYFSRRKARKSSALPHINGRGEQKREKNLLPISGMKKKGKEVTVQKGRKRPLSSKERGGGRGDLFLLYVGRR